MIEVTLREPLTEFTADVRVDIHWFALETGGIATANVVARGAPLLGAPRIDDSELCGTGAGALSWEKAQQRQRP